MMTRDELVELVRGLEDETVLSVYLDVDQHDPAERTTWRRRAEGLASRLRSEVDGHLVESFDQALSHVRRALDRYDAFVPGKGWVAFATSERLWYADRQRVPMPSRMAWEQGARVAPLVRTLKYARPVIVALLDSAHARILEVRGEELQERTALQVDTALGDLSDVGMGKRSATASGRRGETSSDQAQRILGVSYEKMLKELVGVITRHAGSDGLVVLGGIPESVRHAAAALPRPLRERSVERPSLHLGMGHVALQEAAAEAALELARRSDRELLEQVMDQAGAGGRASVGEQATEQALRERRVDTLLLSRSLIQRDPDLADRCVRAAFTQGSQVVELGLEGGDRLDREAEGLCARLRF